MTVFSLKYSPGDDVTRPTALQRLTNALVAEQRQLLAHPIYDRLTNLAELHVFMEHHVFAVWDFMALLKSLQRHLTCVDPLWRPVGDAGSRRLINEIILSEESDEIDGLPTSHFEAYLEAMREVGANTRPIDEFLAQLAIGSDIESAFARACVPTAARVFVRTTFEMIDSGKAHVVCAAFTFGREQAIPGVFGALLDVVSGSGSHLQKLSTYLQRHIELDGQDHGPKALAMLSALTGEDGRKWQESELAARQALAARIVFWSSIVEEIARLQPRVSPAKAAPGFRLPVGAKTGWVERRARA